MTQFPFPKTTSMFIQQCQSTSVPQYNQEPSTLTPTKMPCINTCQVYSRTLQPQCDNHNTTINWMPQNFNPPCAQFSSLVKSSIFAKLK
jgi:hypothetical protein